MSDTNSESDSHPEPESGAGREFDLVLYGATGFVGALTAAYLAEHAPDGLRIALGGRSEQKLRGVRSTLAGAAREWPLVVADASSATDMERLARTARVVVSTVGPYVEYGRELAAACARAGTHYADLTGEVLFVKDSIDRNHDAAFASGAKIVHSCGYDSVPSDLGVLLAHEAAQADEAGGLTEVRTVASFRGGMSGGTADSVRMQIEAAHGDRDDRRVVTDPFALCPDPAAEPMPAQPSPTPPPGRGPDGEWIGPFIFAGYNAQLVRRSNALLDHAYGRSLRYGELQNCGRGPLGAVASVLLTGALGALVAGLSVPLLRPLTGRLLPTPGTGPSEQARRNGWFRMDIDAQTESGARYRARVQGAGDPGYAATAVMLGESALALALDTGRLPDRAGVLTPATALGDVLVDRLRAAGHTYAVVPA
ncbi:saccharopine dehydrogenase family protein [Pseudonocardia phyllosphaerae]|uniref:saccharopine dehydrogenase family protein n=1 Tax=Pseudonocardia phyllosphaerae TaxID=3390502 RepID=UPI00397C3484